MSPELLIGINPMQKNQLPPSEIRRLAVNALKTEGANTFTPLPPAIFLFKEHRALPVNARSVLGPVASALRRLVDPCIMTIEDVFWTLGLRDEEVIKSWFGVWFDLAVQGRTELTGSEAEEIFVERFRPNRLLAKLEKLAGIAA